MTPRCLSGSSLSDLAATRRLSIAKSSAIGLTTRFVRQKALKRTKHDLYARQEWLNIASLDGKALAILGDTLHAGVIKTLAVCVIVALVHGLGVISLELDLGEAIDDDCQP